MFTNKLTPISFLYLDSNTAIAAKEPEPEDKKQTSKRLTIRKLFFEGWGKEGPRIFLFCGNAAQILFCQNTGLGLQVGMHLHRNLFVLTFKFTIPSPLCTTEICLFQAKHGYNKKN